MQDLGTQYKPSDEILQIKHERNYVIITGTGYFCTINESRNEIIHRYYMEVFPAFMKCWDSGGTRVLCLGK